MKMTGLGHRFFCQYFLCEIIISPEGCGDDTPDGTAIYVARFSASAFPE